MIENRNNRFQSVSGIIRSPRVTFSAISFTVSIVCSPTTISTVVLLRRFTLSKIKAPISYKTGRTEGWQLVAFSDGARARRCDMFVMSQNKFGKLRL